MQKLLIFTIAIVVLVLLASTFILGFARRIFGKLPDEDKKR